MIENECKNTENGHHLEKYNCLKRFSISALTIFFARAPLPEYLEQAPGFSFHFFKAIFYPHLSFLITERISVRLALP